MEKTFYPKDIQIFFDEVVCEVKKHLDPTFILISGSFSKKSWIYHHNQLISDFEFVFICNKKWSIKKKRKLLDKLNKKFPYEISLKGYLAKKIKKNIISNYSNKHLGYISTDFYDTFHEPDILYSKYNHILNLNLNNHEIPTWEAWRLYVNRIGDILPLLLNTQIPRSLENYYWLKLFESMGDSFLIVNDLYKKNITDRKKIFSDRLISHSNLTEECKKSVDYIRMSFNSREKHDLSLFDLNNVDFKNRIKIAYSWLEYFEKKLIIDEKLEMGNISFINCYIHSKKLQRKYLEINNIFSIFISNGIRFMSNKKLPIKLLFSTYSSRHIILLTIRSFFKEFCDKGSKYKKSKKILKYVSNKKEINNISESELLHSISVLWKKIR